MLTIAPLRLAELPELEAVLRHEAVYRHIGGLPSSEDFHRGLCIALAGPPPERGDELWLNFSVRRTADGELLGQLQATVHHGLAEVAYLFGPAHWGRGHATAGLAWLHDHLAGIAAVQRLWATTVPANRASVAVLQRGGYAEWEAGEGAVRPMLYSFDDGDRVFWRPVSRTGA